MRKKSFVFIVIYFAFFLVLKAQINIQWQTRYTSAGNKTDRAEDLIMDASGNVYVTGIALGSISGNFDYVTIKYNAAGAQQWIAEYNGPGNSLDEAHAIAIDTLGNVYVTGWSYGDTTTGFDYATVKYNSAGVQQWVSRYTGSLVGTDEAWDIAVDYAGNVFVTGTSDGAGINSAATTVRYNSSGIQQFARRYNGAGSGIDVGSAIYVNKTNGDVFVTGYTYQGGTSDYNFITLKYNLAGVQQWSAMYNGPDDNYDAARAITVDAAGNVYVTGYSQTTVLTNYDYATVKYSVAGVEEWVKRYNGTGDDYDRANAIKSDVSGNIYVTGKSVGTGAAAEDMLTIKYDNSGNIIWTNRYNGPSNGYDEGKALDVDISGNVYITGYSFAVGASNDYLTIKYDSAGTQQWLTRYNGTASNADQATAISVDNIGNVFITGLSKGTGTGEDYETVKYCQLTANAGTDTMICNGASITLSASAVGAIRYSWTPAAGLSDSSIANPIANPMTTTSYIVSVTNAAGCADVDTIVVTVAPLPSPVITADGPISFCIGGSVMLTANEASSYQWSTSATDTSVSINVSASGIYNVTVTNEEGCYSSASQEVTVIPLPSIDGGINDSTCVSTNVNLLATGGLSYSWHPGGTLSDSTIANPVAGPVVTTTYTVIGTGIGGCVNIDSVVITILDNPGLPAVIRSNDTLYCVPDYTAYQWYWNDLPITGASEQMYEYTANGNYYVQVTNMYGCSTQSVITTVDDVGVTEINDLMLWSVYPNPNNGIFDLLINLQSREALTIDITNIAGQLLKQIHPSKLNPGFNSITIEMAELSNGIYFVKIHNDKINNTLKILINK